MDILGNHCTDAQSQPPGVKTWSIVMVDRQDAWPRGRNVLSTEDLDGGLDAGDQPYGILVKGTLFEGQRVSQELSAEKHREGVVGKRGWVGQCG
jgi:hypothetical protein